MICTLTENGERVLTERAGKYTVILSERLYRRVMNSDFVAANHEHTGRVSMAFHFACVSASGRKTSRSEPLRFSASLKAEGVCVWDETPLVATCDDESSRVVIDLA